MNLAIIENIMGDYKSNFIFLALMTTFLELLYQECLQKNMIFQRLGLLLCTMYNSDGWKRKLAMILGYCRYCNGFWLGLIIYWFYFHTISINTLLFSGLVYITLKIFTLIINKLVCNIK